MPQITHEALSEETIQYKELFVLTCNIITFSPLIDKTQIKTLISKKCKDKYDTFKQLYPHYDILLNAFHYFDLILK